MNTTTFLGSSFALALLASLAGAQGSNDCGSAQPIAGLGSFPFDNNGATIDGPFDCNGQPVRRDVWFDWTAPSTGDFKLQTCFGTTLATRVAVYDGATCPPTMQLTCGTGGCVDQTVLFFPAVMNQSYLLRVGSRFVGESGAGMVTMTEDPCPSMPDDAFEPNDDCETESTPIGNGSYPGLFVSKPAPDHYTFGLNPGATVTVDVFFSHAAGDIDIFLRDACTGGTNLAIGGSGNDDEQVTYTNNTAECQTLYLRVEHWLPDTNADCNTYTMTISGVGTCTPPSACTSYCSSLPNATGMPAVLSCAGNPNSSLELTSTPVPNTTGQFFFGPMMLGGGSNLGDGLRCVGGSTTRLLPFVNAGMMMQLPNTASIAINYTAPYAAGLTGTKYFQHWFRSGLATGTGSNTSDGIEVTF